MTKALESRRGQGRLAAMRFLYEWKLNPSESLDDAIELNFRYLKVKAGVANYARRLIDGVIQQQNQLDQVISENLTNWRIERLTVVDLTILRLGVYEMMYIEEVPTRVTINEMVEVGKQYGSADSSGFINGVLDGIRKKCEPEGSPAHHENYEENPELEEV
jgi:transcription antitermination protein NusB